MKAMGADSAASSDGEGEAEDAVEEEEAENLDWWSRYYETVRDVQREEKKKLKESGLNAPKLHLKKPKVPIKVGKRRMQKGCFYRICIQGVQREGAPLPGYLSVTICIIT